VECEIVDICLHAVITSANEIMLLYVIKLGSVCSAYVHCVQKKTPTHVFFYISKENV